MIKCSERVGNAWRMILTSRYPPTDTYVEVAEVGILNKWHADPVVLTELDFLLQHVAECPLMSVSWLAARQQQEHQQHPAWSFPRARQSCA